MSGALQHPPSGQCILLKVWLCPAMTTDDNLWGVLWGEPLRACGAQARSVCVGQLTSCQPHGRGCCPDLLCSSRGVPPLPLVDVMVALQIKWMSSGRAAGTDRWMGKVSADCLFIHPSTIHLPFHIFTYLLSIRSHPHHPSACLPTRFTCPFFTCPSTFHLSVHYPLIHPRHLPVHPRHSNLPSDIYLYTHPSMYHPVSTHPPSIHPRPSTIFLLIHPSSAHTSST